MTNSEFQDQLKKELWALEMQLSNYRNENPKANYQSDKTFKALSDEIQLIKLTRGET